MRRFDNEVASRVARLAALSRPIVSTYASSHRAVPRDRSTERAGLEDPLVITHGRAGAGAGGHLHGGRVPLRNARRWIGVGGLQRAGHDLVVEGAEQRGRPPESAGNGNAV